mmetsp:Transcript_142258/g.454720  ORF Transcript_142258/g.454720 Transcript_142258/m.454720 type:complete len:360 (+) Transcript_142258:579-1658(+)
MLANLPLACPPCLRSSCSRCSRTGVKALLLVATGVSPSRSRNWNSSIVARLALLLEPICLRSLSAWSLPPGASCELAPSGSLPRAAIPSCNSRRMVHNMWSIPLQRFIWDLASSLPSTVAKRSRIRVRSPLETSQRDRHKGQRTAAVMSSGFQTFQSSYLSEKNSHFGHLFVVRPVPDPRSMSCAAMLKQSVFTTGPYPHCGHCRKRPCWWRLTRSPRPNTARRVPFSSPRASNHSRTFSCTRSSTSKHCSRMCPARQVPAWKACPHCRVTHESYSSGLWHSKQIAHSPTAAQSLVAPGEGVGGPTGEGATTTPALVCWGAWCNCIAAGNTMVASSAPTTLGEDVGGWSGECATTTAAT